MKQIAVVYWSGTGNTEAMALEVMKGIEKAGANASLFTASAFQENLVELYDAIAFGCPSMGAEQLEEEEFEPMFEACLPNLKGKNIALFGSYGWGDGEWMDEWTSTCKQAGAEFACESVICNEYPDDVALSACQELGASLVK